jgi:crossover junction endodeoxyribonuclease RuvC
MTTEGYRVLGIDPGLNITGYGLIELGGTRSEPAIVEAGAIRTHARGEIGERIAQIHADLCELIAEHRPDFAAVENLYAHYKHPRTAILMAHARGTVLLACRQADVPVRNLAATMVKRSLTGNGHASKRQMQLAVQSLCRLDELPDPPDVADALAIALCAARRLQQA